MRAGIRTLLAAIAALSLAACDGQDPVDEEANEIAEPADIETLPADVSATTPSNELANGVTNSAAVGQAGGPIPASLHGRWALTPADCQRPVGGAEGGVLVTGREIRFYESVARPVGSVETSADSVTADFAYTGEGATWSRREVFELQDGKLVRTQREPSESFTYARCAS